METNKFNTPILFVVFNRPETTKLVFEEIRKVRPTRLFIAADGPRENRPDDSIKCEEVRKIVSKVDWLCEVKTLFREKNLGCKKAESSAFDWFFENVEMGIILEDDILPNPSFFPYCEELLERYKDDKRVMHISGDNFLQNNSKFERNESYYFSNIPHIWGWASWRRAWNLYDVNVKKWPEVKKLGTLSNIFKNYGAYDYWSYVWDKYHAGKIDSYDGQWVFTCALYGGVSINPTVNLISNIGFSGDGTHTKNINWFSNMKTETINFPLVHPKNISVDYSADDFTFRELFGIDKKIHHRILRPVKKMFPGLHSQIKKIFKK